MDEMTSLREMRASVPERDTDRLAPVRARVLRETGRRRVLRAVWPRPVMRLAVAGVVAAALVVTAVYASGPTEDRPAGGDQPKVSAAAVLEQAALVAESRPTGAEPDDRQWEYTKTLSKQPDGRKDTNEGWIRYDGWPYLPDPGDDDLSPKQYRKKLMELPTDPDALLAHVRGDRHWIDYPKESKKGNEEPPDRRAFRVLGVYMNQQAIMPPKLEATIYRALAKIPGVKIQQGVTDAAGRRGIGVYRDEVLPVATTRTFLILQPGGYRYLGRTDVTLRGPEWMQGTFSTALLASRIVDERGDRE